MSAIAITVGSSKYKNLQELTCCQTDVEALTALLNATGRFDTVKSLVDLPANELKRQLRSILNADASEVFFYYSGHGHCDESGEFYFCAHDFDTKIPNESGLSNSELMALLKETSPELAIKVIDACYSGTLMIKSGQSYLPQDKGGLTNLVQIASCQDSQTSLTGDPLSEFTEAFCRAAVRLNAGPTYYIDIVSSLKDRYLSNKDRFPHFVFQCSAREIFSEDNSTLVSFREVLDTRWSKKAERNVAVALDATECLAPQESSLSVLLRQAEERLGKPEDVSTFVDHLFDGIKNKFSGQEFNDYFEISSIEHSDFLERSTRVFIIRIMNSEKRRDNFVSAEVKRKLKSGRSFGGLATTAVALAGLFANDDDYEETMDLSLNMSMARVQLSITFTPKFSSLQMINLVVTCAPSLENCYVFELATRYLRTDWSNFSPTGVEITRRWYKMEWRENTDSLIDKIAAKLNESIEEHLSAVANRLGKA